MKDFKKTDEKDPKEEDKNPKTAKGKAPGVSKDDTSDDKEANVKDKIEFNPDVKEDFEWLVEGIDEDLFTLEERIAYAEEVGQIDEVLSYQGRMKHRAVMKRYKSQLQRKHERALTKYAAKDVINRRARRKAIDTLKTRYTQGRSQEDLSVAEKQRIERMIAARKKLVTRLATRLVKNVKQTERQRMSNR